MSFNSLKSDSPIEIDFENEKFRDVGLYAITGSTGAGKTTFLKQILIYTIKTGDFIPFFINLTEWAEQGELTRNGLLKYIAKQFETAGINNAEVFIDYTIEEGIAILLFE